MLQVLDERYREQLQDELFQICELPWDSGVHLSTELFTPNRESVLILEARAAREEHPKLSDKDLMHLCLDMTGYLLDVYLIEDPGTAPGLDWAQMFYAGASVYVQGNYVNESLERLADRLINGDGPPDEPTEDS